MNETLLKLAYNYIDDLLEKARQSLQFISTQKPFNKAAYDDIETRYRVLLQKRYAPFAETNPLATQLQAAISKANMSSSQDLTKNLDDTGRMRPIHQWENNPTGGLQAINKTPNADPSQPEWVVLPGLKLLGPAAQRPSQAAQYIKDQLGDAVHLRSHDDDPKFPNFDTYIRGTKESWNKFLALAPTIFDSWNKLPQANKLGLKSENDFNPDYTEQNGELARYPLNVEVLNTNGSQDIWDIGNKKNEKAYKPAIRLRFDEKDPNFYAVGNLTVRELDMPTTRINRTERTIDIYDLNGGKLAGLSNKLQQLPYKYPVKSLNDAITLLTGQSIGDIKKRVGDKVKSAPLSEKVIQNRIDSNQLKVGEDRVQFDTQIEQMYPGAFNPKYVSERQKQAQKDGMFFIVGRGSSILADEPGAGKTAQSIVGADFATTMQDREAAQSATEMGQPAPPKKKILVFTPLPLVGEHWTSGGGQQSKPEMYCGQQPDSIVHIRSLADFDKIGPNTRWVVIPYTTMAQSKDSVLIARRIAQDSKNGVYGATILDELQTVKSLDGPQGSSLQLAISSSGIKHRVGLTGTPADNDPTDLYKQLRITRHPLLYDTDGTLQQTEKGFAEQFLGGSAVTDEDIIKKKKQYRLVVEGRIDSLMNWARNVNKDMLIKLFTSTYLRRTKNDMRDDMTVKDRNRPTVIDGHSEKWAQRFEELKATNENPWQPLEEEMANAKIPYTISSAVKHLTESPDAKVFVVTKYPDIAEKIAAGINAQMSPDGSICAAVSGDTSKMAKLTVPNTFKRKGGILKGKTQPLRCVVYTMAIGAVGLNFGMANKAIFNDIAWNPSTNLQAEDRVHRIDSQHDVSVEYLYFAGTYDEEMFNRVRRKEAINKEINGVLRQASMNPESADHVANQFILSLVDSLLFDLHMDENEKQYAEQKKAELKQFLEGQPLPMVQPFAQPMPAVASTWYNRFKTATRVHKYKW